MSYWNGYIDYLGVLGRLEGEIWVKTFTYVSYCVL